MISPSFQTKISHQLFDLHWLLVLYHLFSASVLVFSLFFYFFFCAKMDYATAEMLQLLLSLLRQSKPSILTAAGVWPNFIGTQPRAEEEDASVNGLKFPLPNCSSWITGFEALLGGDPQKNGGDDATTCPPDLVR